MRLIQSSDEEQGGLDDTAKFVRSYLHLHVDILELKYSSSSLVRLIQSLQEVPTRWIRWYCEATVGLKLLVPIVGTC